MDPHFFFPSGIVDGVKLVHGRSLLLVLVERADAHLSLTTPPLPCYRETNTEQRHDDYSHTCYVPLIYTAAFTGSIPEGLKHCESNAVYCLHLFLTEW